jgi:amino acid adenylation domain-containing protein/thioester reductase-like protein
MKEIDFFLVGQGNLFKQCIEHLQMLAHVRVIGIVSPDPSIKHWAMTQDFDYADSISQLLPLMKQVKFDYLISIVNNEIITEDVLSLPTRFAINYHDSLLPKYAGIHATSWSILNAEKLHGVSWHIMEKGIDSGDILKQLSFELKPNETVLSLNLKCYEAAYKGFEELVEELISNTYLRSPQNLKHRSYYKRHQKPLANGIIDFNRTAQDISKTHCASTFGGNYHNNFMISKLIISDEIYIPQKISVLADSSEEIPGKILEFSDDNLRVSTKTQDILIHGIKDKYTQPQSFAHLKRCLKINNNKLLPSLSLKAQEKVRERAEKLSKHEEYWLNHLQQMQTANLSMPVNDKRENNYRTLCKQKLSSSFLGTNDSLFLITSILIYIYRTNDYQEVVIDYSNNNLINNFCDESKSWPISTSFSPNDDFDTTLKKVRHDLEEKQKKTGFLKDIYSRYPEFKDKALENNITIYVGDMSNLNKLSTRYVLSHQNNELILFTNSCNTNLNLSSCFLKGCLQVMYNCLLDPGVILNELEIVTQTEKHLLLNRWSPNKAVHRKLSCVLDDFQSHAQTGPDRPALKCGDKTLTYTQLDKFSNKIARYLKRKNIFVQECVPIYFSTSINMVALILALAKIRAIYIPIKLGSPTSRIREVIKDSSAKLLITESYFVEELKNHSITLLNIDLAMEEITNESDKDLKTSYDIEDILYIIYTSGTTGKPKGVQTSHSNLKNLFDSAAQAFDFTNQDRWSLFHSYAFDFSVWELWGALTTGANAIMISEEVVASPMNFLNLVLREKITILNQTPQAFKLFAEYVVENRLRDLLTLKYVIFGGEILDNKVLEKWCAHMPINRPHLINMYGITETTVHTTFYELKENSIKNFVSLPVGKPLNHLKIFILDKHENLMPIGIQGEAYISGGSVSKGYINKPSLTTEKFPTIKIDGGSTRAYRSGDYLKWTLSGNLIYRGRIDRQVKVRGYRIELETVEKSILKYEPTVQCAVICKKIKSGDFLFAYIVLKDKVRFNVEKIKKFLKTLMPEYMLPSRYILMNALPLTTNWKVDTSQLPEPKFIDRSYLEAKYSPPHTATQEYLSTIWKNILELDDIGINDNFFLLGGDSLLVTRVVLEIKKKYNSDIPLHTFFKNPTVKQLAILIDGTKAIDINHSTLYQLIDKDLESIKNLSVKQDPIQHEYSAALLTGANGFLGINLLYELISSTETDVFCLVRGDSKLEAISRLNLSAKKHIGKTSWLDNKRIKAINGDIALAQFGLSNSIYNELSISIKYIFHNAAQVHHVYNYEILRNSNVIGTKNIIEFAADTRKKDIYYTSTLSTLSEQDKNGCYTERFPQCKTDYKKIHDGYGQTKWVAEYLLGVANTKGISTTIFRLGWIFGRSDNGRMSYENNHLLLLLKSCTQLGVAPDWDYEYNILPVDKLSKLLVTACTNKEHIENRVFNVINTNIIHWKQIIECFCTHGFSVKFISEMTWLNTYLISLQQDNALYPLLPLYMSNEKEKPISNIGNISSSNHQRLLKNLGVEMPTISTLLLDKYIQYLLAEHYLEPPAYRHNITTKII